MAFKTIAVILQNADNARRALDCAIPVAEAWDAHVIGIHAAPIPVAYTDAVGFPDVGVIEAAAAAVDERGREVEALFAERMAGSRLSHDWHRLRNVAGDNAFFGAEIARTADVVLVAQRNPEATDEAAGIDGAIHESGRPVLVAPYAGPVPSSFQRILIAWNGSREAARAAFDALPLIEKAETTEILVVDPPEEGGEMGMGASSLAAALSRHGAHVAVTTQASGKQAVDEVLRDRIAATGADLLVIGANSHSWLRDLVFGGVTKTVLKSVEIPTLLSR